jgi:peptidoglycan/xylan/chitin deacetylase (PgdA/CDA1 family)
VPGDAGGRGGDGGYDEPVPLLELEPNVGRPFDRHASGRGKRTLPFALVLLSVTLAAACAAPIPTTSPAASPATSLPSTVTAAPTVTDTPTPTPSCQSGCTKPADFVRHGSRTVKAVALTFDDGFNVPGCISIVNTLLAKDATATFFPNGQYVRENPSFWHWVAANGFPIGNHTTTHNDPRTLAAQQLELNLDSDRRIVDETLGVPSINAFRPPYGDYDLLVQEVAAVVGYPLLVGWDVDSKDQTGVAGVAAEIANATTGTDGSIVLMHCGSPLTPLALPSIIDGYRARGFSFVTIPEMFDLPSPTAGWMPPMSPDPRPVDELAPADPQPSWNASPAIDASGHLHVAYETPAGIEYGDDGSGSWLSETIAMSTGSTFVSRPSVALDPGGGVDLVYLSSTTSGTLLQYRHRTSDGVWSSPESVATLSAPASTATIATDSSGQPVIAYALLGGAHEGIILARQAAGSWSHTPVPTTDRTFLSPSIAIDSQGAIHLIERRNGYPEVDETTNASGAWTTTRLLAVLGSAVAFAAFDPSGRLVVAAQESYGPAVTLGIRSPDGSLTWTTVTGVGDLSGLAIAADGNPHVAFSRIPQSGGASRIWLAGTK